VKKIGFFTGMAFILCVIAIASVPAQAGAGDDIVLSVDPAAIHQEMWKDLQTKLAQRQVLETLSAVKTASNWQEYDMDYYAITLDIDHVSEFIHGSVDTYGTVTVSQLDTVMINLLNSMTVDSIYNATGNLTFVHQNDHITVYLDRTYAQDEQFNFTVVYNGHPSSSQGFLGLSFSTRNGLPLITTLSEPMGARSWWPCNDIPRDKFDSLDITVTVDTSLVVSSNGLIVYDTDNGDGTHTVHWKSKYPITPYLVSLGIHPYAVWYDYYNYTPTDSMPLHFYVYPDHDAYSRTFFDSIVAHMIDVLEDDFGQYPFIDEKYGCTHFDWGGAMEHQTNTSTTSSSFGYSQPVVCHELGHQWWGDMVTCSDWHNIWINEGFAVYSEALYFEADSGIDYYHAYMNSFEYTSGGSVYIYDTTSVWNIFGAIVYDKGGWVLHMLRHVVGDSLFFQALDDYRQQYQWKAASTEDFRDVVEATSGMELDWFFDQWIYGTYRPNYRFSHKILEDPAGGWNTYLHIRQIQMTDPQFFTMPIDIKLNTVGGPEMHVLFNDQPGQNFVLHSDSQPLTVEFDPDRWISRSALNEGYTLHIINDDLVDGTLAGGYDDTVIVIGPNGGYTCEIIDGALPDGLSLSAGTGVISGLALEQGTFQFTVRATSKVYTTYKDSVVYVIDIGDPVEQRPGDANIDSKVDVGDAVYIINFVFTGGDAPIVPNWADVNGDCEINVGDAVHMINYIFKGGPGPEMGCVE
jgi:hypothetical protein